MKACHRCCRNSGSFRKLISADHALVVLHTECLYCRHLPLADTLHALRGLCMPSLSVQGTVRTGLPARAHYADPPQDNLAMAATRFLTTVARSVHHALFRGADVLKQVCCLTSL